jgi:hypothetical protein
MKKLFPINIKTFLLKVLLIFFIGFASRMIIHHYLGVNVLLEYTNNISILYYLSLLSLTIYLDQIYSFYLYIPVDSFNNIEFFKNDSKITNLLLTKDYKNGSYSPSSTDHSSGYSKTNRKPVTINGKYTYLRPVVNNKGDILLVSGLDLGKHGSNSTFNIPPAPKPSNLSTPSTMSPLFPSSSKSVSFNEPNFYRSPKPSNLSHESQEYRTTNSKHTKSTGNVPIWNDRRYLPKRYTFDSADFADRRKRVIESVEQKIKESSINKPAKKTCILNKISSSLNYADSQRTSKLFKQPIGNTDIISQEKTEEIKRKGHARELERQAFYTMLSWKKR